MNSKSKILPNNKIVSLLIVLFMLGGFFTITSGILYEPAPRFSGNTSTNSGHTHNVTPTLKSQQIMSLEQEVENSPANYDNVLKLAHLLGDNGFYLDAIKRYDQYLEKYPKVADVIVDKGVCYYNNKDYNKAISVMESAIKIDPKHEIAHLNLGVVNMAAGNKDDAINWWTKLIKINPNSNYAKRAKDLINSH